VPSPQARLTPAFPATSPAVTHHGDRSAPATESSTPPTRHDDHTGDPTPVSSVLTAPTLHPTTATPSLMSRPRYRVSHASRSSPPESTRPPRSRDPMSYAERNSSIYWSAADHDRMRRNCASNTRQRRSPSTSNGWAGRCDHTSAKHRVGSSPSPRGRAIPGFASHTQANSR